MLITPCEIAQHQLKLLAESIHGTVFSVIVADSAWGSLKPGSTNQVVIAQGRTDRQGKRLTKNDNDDKPKGRGRPPKYAPGVIRFIDDLPPGSENGSDEEFTYEDLNEETVLSNRWYGVYGDLLCFVTCALATPARPGGLAGDDSRQLVVGVNFY